VRVVHAEVAQGPADVHAEPVRPHLGQDGGASPQPGGSDCDVGRGAAEGLRKGADVLERSRLLRVQVHPDATDGEELEVGHGHHAPTYLSMVCRMNLVDSGARSSQAKTQDVMTDRSSSPNPRTFSVSKNV